MPGSVRELSVWKLTLPVGAWKERKSWSLNSVLVSSRGTLSGTGVVWLKSLYFKPSIKHSFKLVLKDAFSQYVSLFLWLRDRDAWKLPTFHVATVLLNLNRSVVNSAWVLYIHHLNHYQVFNMHLSFWPSVCGGGLPLWGFVFILCLCDKWGFLEELVQLLLCSCLVS